MRTLLLILAIFLSLNLYSQENTSHRKGLTFKGGLRYLGWTNASVPNPEDYRGYEELITFPYKAHGKSLRLYAGYFVFPKLSLNLGFGLDRYEVYGTNTAPWVVQGNYYLSPNKNSFFVSAEVGTQIAFSEALDEGYVYALALGKEISFSGKNGLNIYLGYNFQQSRYEHNNRSDDAIYLDKLNRKSLIFGVDFVIF